MTLITSKSQTYIYYIHKISYHHDKEGNIKYNKSGNPIYSGCGYEHITASVEAKLYGFVVYQGLSHRVINIEKRESGEPDFLTIVIATEKNILPPKNRLTVLN